MLKQPQFALSALTLIESNFKRDQQILVRDEDKSKVKQTPTFEIKTTPISEGRFGTFLIYNYVVQFEEKEIISFKVVYAGTFEVKGEYESEQLELFSKVNAPAIIFPFVREVISNLASKAMIGPFLIQPINFATEYEKTKKK